jgi:murein peptide amidase A
VSESTLLATLLSGRKIHSYKFGCGSYHLLLVGGVHGNEIEGVELISALMTELEGSVQFPNLTILVVPNVNPDGVAAKRRQNENWVDLNRNLPTKDWTSEAMKPEYQPGASAGSEVESQVVVNLVEKFKPNYIISMHSFRDAMINTNGDCGQAAQVMHQACGLPIKDDIGYPTPGSLGTYAGWERGIPTITLEVLRGEDLDKMKDKMLPALLKTMEHLNESGKR